MSTWPTDVPDDREVPPREEVVAAIKRMVDHLARGEYDALCTLALAKHQHPEWLRRAVDDYGRTLVPLPEEAFELTDLGPVLARSSCSWLEQPLWTKEGRSDLPLLREVTRTEGGWLVSVDDIHVL
jgi:hypothetical protein